MACTKETVKSSGLNIWSSEATDPAPAGRGGSFWVDLHRDRKKVSMRWRRKKSVYIIFKWLTYFSLDARGWQEWWEPRGGAWLEFGAELHCQIPGIWDLTTTNFRCKCDWTSFHFDQHPRRFTPKGQNLLLGREFLASLSFRSHFTLKPSTQISVFSKERGNGPRVCIFNTNAT